MNAVNASWWYIVQTSALCTRKQLGTSAFKVKLTHSTLCLLKLPHICSCRFGYTVDRVNKGFFSPTRNTDFKYPICFFFPSVMGRERKEHQPSAAVNL